MAAFQVSIYRESDPAAAVRGAMERLGGMAAFVSPGERVLIKPNGLFQTFKVGAVTDPRVVAAVAQLVLVSAVATMVSYAFSAGAEIKWLALDRGKIPVAHFARKMTIAVLALVFTIFAFYGGGVQEIYWLWMLIVLGVPLYIYILWRRANTAEPADADISG